LKFLYHTQLDTNTRYDSSEQVISSSLPTQHTTDTRDKHPCAQRVTNPRSQQLSSRRPTS